jgi:diguanylate cyclase (GGDEF)-like protein/PAS domain S-box-containing protein
MTRKGLFARRAIDITLSPSDQFDKYKAEIERLKRLYDTLRLVNHACSASKTRNELSNEICRIVVENGGFTLAWIGWIDPKTERIVPAAQYGDCGSFLSNALMYADDRPDGRGTAGLAIRKGKSYICNDYLNDPATPLWRSDVQKHSFRANGMFPLCLDQAVVGVLTVYALVPGYFQSKEIALLEQVAEDVSFAIGKFFHREERMKAQKMTRQLAIIAESTNDAIVSKSLNGTVVNWNAAAERMFGYTAEEICGQNFSILVPLDRIDEERSFLQRIRSGEQIIDFETVRIRKNGQRFPVSTTISPIRSDNGDVIGASKIARDITERKQAEERLHLAASVFTHASEGIMITAADGTIIEVNDTFTQITGYSREEVLGRKPRLLNSGRQGREFYAAMWRALIEEGHWAGEIWNRDKHGRIYPEMLTISAVLDESGQVQQYVALFSDITTIKEREQQLEHIAHYDTLTGLLNRILLVDRLNQAMAQSHRREQLVAVAYLDLDGFKVINDCHGHDAGDQLLAVVASRMKTVLRAGDTLARLGGDEFAAVLLDLEDVEAGVPMLTRLLRAASQPVQVGDLDLHVSVSIGVTFYPQAGGVDADQLLRQADQAMYQAKLNGKGQYHIFDFSQDRSVRSRHEDLKRMGHALAAQEFVLYYQPIVNMRKGTIVGAEALIRWQHSERGLLRPGVFLPVIEDHPLAIELGEWVIDTALTQVESWQAAGLDIPVSVNVGARQLQESSFVDRVAALLEAHPRVKPSCLKLEILETSALHDTVQVSQLLEGCREIGVSFALDDFGTGYSSLGYLKRLPVDVLKIDRGFVHDIFNDPEDLNIIEGILGLGAAFRYQVIAEGVETVKHGLMLLRMGCELAQGFAIAPPMLADDFSRWAAEWQPDPCWIDVLPARQDEQQLFYAAAEQRCWIMAIESFLKGERHVSPRLTLDQCRFSAWMDAQNSVGRGELPEFQALDDLHRQLHALAADIVKLKDRGKNSESKARLGKLRTLRDALLEHLELYTQNSCV